jgi:hypothetical protein
LETGRQGQGHCAICRAGKSCRSAASGWTSANALGGEVFDHRNEWDFLKLAPALGKRPVLLISANDGTGPNSDALFQILKQAGITQSAHVEIKTDHPFSDHRIALETTILNWLDQQGFQVPAR